jgi:hypothetical protein
MCLEKNHIMSRRQTRYGTAKKSCEACERNNFLFIIFVDRIFTSLFERLFTNVFDVSAQTSTNPCVYRARHAD